MKKIFKYTLFALFVWLFVHTIVLLAVGLSSNTKKTDVILILGNKVEVDGTPSKRLKSRLDTGAELYHKKQAPLIIVSGGLGKEVYDEAKTMKEYLISKDIPSSNIIVDDEGNNTYMTAMNYKSIARQRKLKSVTVVSQYYHLLRTKMTLKKFGIDHVYTSKAQMFPELRDFYSIPREIVGYYSYLLKDYTAETASTFFSEPYVEVRKGDLWYGDVYFVNKEGKGVLVSTSKSVENGLVTSEFDSIFYIDALLSPDERKIAIVGACWEDDCVSVYDIDTKELHETFVASSQVEWLDDGRLKIVGGCSNPVDFCGVYESQNSSKPWELEKTIGQKTKDNTYSIKNLNFGIEETIPILYRGSFGYEEKEKFVELGRPMPEDLFWGSVEYLYTPRGQEFKLLAQANMSDNLGDGEFYNGWLTNGMKTEYVNTGKLIEATRYGEIIYGNGFVSDSDYSDYQIYIISREKGDVGVSPRNEMVLTVLLKVQ
ncbi:hypothetical protein C0581_01885 [Candidatus Parcubacteria bacterium]|nr:MAG: hypothetical protein C0581_01885 [Candidatus Parcubacteria bacterium]